MGKARTNGGGIAKRSFVLLTLCVLFAAGVGTAAASGNGTPGSPPGQGECEHGNSGAPCRDDPQPERGEDCELHGNQGGINEDHCGGVTAPELPPPTTTISEPPPPTTVTTTTATTTQTTTSAPSNAPPPPTTTTSPPATPEHEPKQEESNEERAQPSTPTKATTPNTTDATNASQETVEPKQGVGEASAPDDLKCEAGCAPARVLVVAPKTAEESLPFTGLPLWVFFLGGLAALMAGLAVRRLARPVRQTAE